MTTPEDRERESRATDETTFERAAESEREQREQVAEQLEQEPPLQPQDE